MRQADLRRRLCRIVRERLFFAAKEAFLKAAGTGLGGFALTDLTVLRKESGAPYFALTGPAAEWTAANALTPHLSLTHENGLACAFVILEQNK